MAKLILEELTKVCEREAQFLIANLKNEWPGDDPTLMQTGVSGFLYDFAMKCNTEKLHGSTLVITANNASDEFYADVIQRRDDTVEHQLRCRYKLSYGLLTVAGSNMMERHLLVGWHMALMGGLMNAVRNQNTRSKDEV